MTTNTVETASTPKHSEEILALEIERLIWEWQIDNIFKKPNYSIEELDKLAPWISNNIESLFDKTIWVKELQLNKTIVLWRLDQLWIDPDSIIIAEWLTLLDYFFSIERVN